MKKTVTESIFNGATAIIPLAEVQHIEKDQRERYKGGLIVVMSGSTWNQEIDFYNNTPYLSGDEAESFKKAWCRYRSELETETLVEPEA